MPAISKRQQMAMGAELSRRRSGKKGRFKGLSNQQLREFAGTPRKDLPLKVLKEKRRH